jgi:bacteriocin biosynthesis cyclodehydratase domain-containing protein
MAGEKTTKAIERNAKAIGNFLHGNVSNCDLVIAALRNIPVAVFDTINEICVKQSVEWLRGHDNGSHLEVGPYVKPYDSACFECMSIRQISAAEHAVEEELYLKSLEEEPRSTSLYGESIALATLASSYLTQEAVRIVTAIERPALDGSVISFYSDGNIDQNTFMRVPRCEVCARGGALVFPEKTHAGKVS